MIDVILHRDRDRSVRRRHPWLLSGAVQRVEDGAGTAEPGSLARVVSAEGEVLGFGFFSPRSQLRVRFVRFGKDAPGPDWLEAQIARAVARREQDPLLAGTDAVRLVNAEGDGLPGLVADRYADVVVVRLGTAGMALRREAVAAGLRGASGAAVGFERADPVAARREGVAARQGPLWGEPPSRPVAIRERGRRYRVDVCAGQKTGFYLDQRDTRERVQELAGGRRVLDLFAYTGGCSLAAARGGASSLTLVESSATAVALARENLASLPVPPRVVAGDSFRFLREDAGEYDLLIIDPPPLARQRRDVPRAARAYKDLFLHALRRAAPGARLLVFACSHHVAPELFRKIVLGAALDARREVRVLGAFCQPPDHPVALEHPEGAYLTGLLLEA